VTVSERPDLAEPAWQGTRDANPEYNNHRDALNRYRGRLTEADRVPIHLVGDGEA
jgi:hypothetical protein